MSAAALCSLAESGGLSEELMTEDEQRAKAAKRERELRAIEMLRPEAQGEQSEEYRCTSCKGSRCNLFHTNSMGAVHLTAVPDMIIECLDCGHRFTL